MAESTFGGAGRLIGTNGIQASVDAIGRTITRLDTMLSRLVPALESAGKAMGGLRGSYNAGLNWRSGGSISGGANGGGGTFSGAPARGTTAPVAPSGSPITIPGMGQWQKLPSGIYTPPGTQTTLPNGGTPSAPPTPSFGGGNGVSGAAFVAGAAVDIGSQIANSFRGQSKEDASLDSRLGMTLGAMESRGSGMSFTSMYGKNASSMNGADQYGSMYSAYQNTGYSYGTANFNKFMGGVTATSTFNPMVSNASAASAQAAFGSVQGYVGLRRVGIDSVTKGGNRKTTLQIANEVLKQVDPTESIRGRENAKVFVNDPMSYLNQTLGNWLANGIISGDQMSQIKDNVLAILLARTNGVGVSQLQSLVTAAQGPKADKKALGKLRSMGIADDQMSKDKNAAAEGRRGAQQRLDGFARGLGLSTDGLAKFNKAINDATKGLHTNYLMGFQQGLRENGVKGMMGAGAISPGKRFTDGALAGFQAGTGGDNESRMSVLAGGGGGGGSGMLHAAGGRAGIGGGGGGGGHKGGGSTKLIWPCNGPLTAGFGQSGSRWAHKHTGQDIAVPVGTPIKAAAAGSVTFAGGGGAYGNLVKIDHGNGIQTWYAHNSRLLVSAGNHVAQGKVIAYSGATGNVTGPHCHFEVRINGNPVNPLPYLKGAPLSMSDSGGGSTAGSDSSLGTTGSSSLGSGTSYSGGGTSEGAIVASALSGSSGSGSGTSDGGMSSGSSAGPGSGAGSVAPGSGSGVEKYRPVVIDAMKRLGVASPAKSDVDRALMQMKTESGGNPSVVNKWDVNWKQGHPSVGLMQVIAGTFKEYAGPFAKTGPFEYGVSTDPEANIYAALNYARSRYGSWSNAFKGHGYDKGAWELKQDETARVHKGEMIVPKPAADQIRQVLLNGNPYGAKGNRATGGGVVIEFKPGSIQVNVGAGASRGVGRAIGKDIVDEISRDARIKALTKGTA